MMDVTKQRRRSVFDAIQEIDSEDVKAEKLRRRRSHQDASQARAAQKQIKVYSNLLECRILLQRVLTTAAATTTATATLANKEQESKPAATGEEIQEECDQILEMLLEARASLMGEEFTPKMESADYRRLLQSLSSSSQKTTTKNSVKVPGDQVSKVLQSEYESCREYWKEVLNRRYKDLRLHAGLTSAKQAHFRVLDSTFWQQVDATVLTQENIWKQQLSTDDSPDGTVAASTSAVDVIGQFDDSKLYRLLLQDFLSLSTTSSTAGDEMSNQRRFNIGTNNNKKNHEKQVERKASKGRKIRYVTIPKLVNFTFPMTRPQPPSSAMLDENEWFQSLFGNATGKAV